MLKSCLSRDKELKQEALGAMEDGRGRFVIRDLHRADCSGDSLDSAHSRRQLNWQSPILQ